MVTFCAVTFSQQKSTFHKQKSTFSQPYKIDMICLKRTELEHGIPRRRATTDPRIF